MDDETLALLAQLQDISLPDDPSWWPPAPGWWWLLILILFGAYKLYRFFQVYSARTAMLKSALHALNTIENNLARHSTAWGHQALADLLKRLSISAFPEKDIASLTGKSWSDFIEHYANAATNINPDTLIQSQLSAYKASPSRVSEIEITAYRNWIRAYPPVPEKEPPIAC